jgi:hypothetical protein
MLAGLTVDAEVAAPWDAPPDIATHATIAIVVPEEDAAIDAVAPQFLKLASVSWKADARRFVYTVGREVYSEPVAPQSGKSQRLALYVEDDSTVSFAIDGQRRWRSTLRLTTSRTGSRAQVWISGRATLGQVRLTSLSVALAARDSLPRR